MPSSIELGKDARRQNRKQRAGICRSCESPAKRKAKKGAKQGAKLAWTLCNRCRKLHNKKRVKKYHKRLALGWCVEHGCLEQHVKGRTRCPKHLAENRAYFRSYKRFRRLLGRKTAHNCETFHAARSSGRQSTSNTSTA